MIEIDGEIYWIDLDALLNWVAETPLSEKLITTATTITYPMAEDDIEVFEKEITENKSSLNETFNNIRYDLIKNLLSVLFATHASGVGDVLPHTLKEMTFGQRIVFNTLLNKNIIVKENNK